VGSQPQFFFIGKKERKGILFRITISMTGRETQEAEERGTAWLLRKGKGGGKTPCGERGVKRKEGRLPLNPPNEGKKKGREKKIALSG